jgi:hypothetical protein
VRNFAIAHGKPMASLEWGAVISPNGGGDNPYFIQKMQTSSSIRRITSRLPLLFQCIERKRTLR